MSRVIVVTGASRGIGRATAELFAKRGDSVFTLSRSPCPVAGVTHLSTDFLHPDFADQAAAFFEANLHDKEKIVLIHNAAGMVKDTALTTDASDLEDLLQLNVVAPTVLNKLLFQRMTPGSSILYVGSTLSEKAVAGTSSYVVSKHALAGLAKATCQDLIGTQIHSVCVCPGFTDTEMLREHVGHDEGVLDFLGNMSAFGRLIQPQEIAETLAFCADHPVVNGAILHANLGQKES
ncbi:MAG: SDR family oxidoreductase [Deltaproteobacteria bacterium]|nr:SDR family oxidoreductase [Deltaproteobacteria bacterium]